MCCSAVNGSILAPEQLISANGAGGVIASITTGSSRSVIATRAIGRFPSRQYHQIIAAHGGGKIYQRSCGFISGKSVARTYATDNIIARSDV